MTVESIRTLIAPLQGMHLLLPNAAVAEVVRGKALAPANNVPNWFVGEIEWRQRKVPVIHLEAMLLVSNASVDVTKPMLICHSLNPQAEFPFIGILIDQMPKLTQVRSVNLSGQIMDAEYQRAPLKAKLMFNNQIAYIPDLPALEARYASIAA